MICSDCNFVKSKNNYEVIFNCICGYSNLYKNKSEYQKCKICKNKLKIIKNKYKSLTILFFLYKIK